MAARWLLNFRNADLPSKQSVSRHRIPRVVKLPLNTIVETPRIKNRQATRELLLDRARKAASHAI